MSAVTIPEGCLQILLEVHAVNETGKKRAVRYKMDGQRFAGNGSDVTVKFRVEQAYQLTFLISPPSSVTGASICMQDPVQDLSPGPSCPLVPSQESSSGREVEGASNHSFTWRCNLSPCPNNTRGQLSLCLDVDGFGSVTLPLQVKSYPDDVIGRKHLIQGRSLRHLQFLLKRTSDNVTLAGKISAFGTFHSDEVAKGPAGGAWYLS